MSKVTIKDLLSDKQNLSISQAKKRICVWSGAVRSGKTYSSIIKFLSLLAGGPPGDVMIVGFTRSSIQRNVLAEICRIVGSPMPPSKNTEIKVAGRTIYLIGANDERAVSRIQGSTLALAYVDECTTIPRAFFNMLLSRLSVPGAQLLVTCNPEGPNHWLKKDFIDKPDHLDIITWQFILDDNPSLEEAYKENLKKEYNGVWYRRLILGEWTVAHGLVYDGFDEDNIYEHEEDLPSSDYWIAALDYGITNPTVCLLAGISPNRYPQIKVQQEYYYSSSDRGRAKTDSELADDIIKFISWKPIKALYIDPSAASLRLELQRRNVPVVDAKNDVLLGIKITSKFISGKNLVVHKKCENFIEEIAAYAWDSKASDRGVDKPIKDKDHCFVAGTQVLTSTGSKPIETIEIGDEVLTRGGYRPVLKTFQHKAEVREFDILGKKITCTPEHKFMTIEGWKEAQHLIQSDILVTNIDVVKNSKSINTDPQKTVAVNVQTQKKQVYNLHVDEYHEYFVEGILVKNCMDTIRYLCASNFPTGELSHSTENISMQMRRQKAFGESSSLGGMLHG